MACGGGGSDLRVDLRTDYIPNLEVSEVRTQVFRDDALSDLVFTETRALPSNGDAFEGFRAAEGNVASGIRRVVVELTNAGALVARRVVVVDVRGTTGVTVLITRDCEGVMCPDTNPTATECLGGRCVAPECTPETPEACPDPQCTDDSECDVDVPCAEPRCVAGACTQRFLDDRCDTGEQCDPTRGCAVLSVDASMDASVDASVDVPVDVPADVPADVFDAGTPDGDDSDGGDCASRCPGTCMGEVCVITDPVVDTSCPPGLECEFICASAATCPAVRCTAANPRCDIQCNASSTCGTINCNARRCDVSCSVDGTCVTVTTNAAERSNIACTGSASCATVTCEGGRCDIECAFTSCAAIDCTESCACDVMCSLCTPSCPPACAAGLSRCDRDLAGCDTCP